MPPQQRYLPSTWDRGGLLGPRGNARFLEVDGLRVKYIGRLVFGRERTSSSVGGWGGIRNVATLADVFFSKPTLCNALCAFVCLGLLFCDVLKK